MGYKNLSECLKDLTQKGELLQIDTPVDARLEAGAIQRRVFQAGGPALLFTRVRGCDFPMVANIFGTMDRTRFIFRDTLKTVERLLSLKADPVKIGKHPHRYLGLPKVLWNSLPRKVKSGPVLERETTVSRLPQLVSWPMDGGGYVTLPQVYSENPAKPGFFASNLGMYRVQLTGNSYEKDREVGLHYQIHRGIGPHHAEAIRQNKPLPLNIFIGGPPAMTFAAVMPLPEGIPELLFAGALGGRRMEMIPGIGRLPILSEADFCITGTVAPKRLLPEGPFGDHLGYYSLVHDFPVLRVERVYHRIGAVWPFTTVGRPPQEDTVLGTLIHEMTHDLVPTVFYGVHEVHAVDAAGVHPLLLALGSERYVPFSQNRRPQELLTCAMGLFGNTQTALSKYLLIAAKEDNENLKTRDIPDFFSHILERIDFSGDLHFITRTTMDTLDYSGIHLNQGSKLIMAVCGPSRRRLAGQLPPMLTLPQGFSAPGILAPGIMIVKGPLHDQPRDTHDPEMNAFAQWFGRSEDRAGFPLVVVVDDVEFTAADWDSFLWVTFTRSDPATDIYGYASSIHCKHWQCEKHLIIDARKKPYHAPVLEPDPAVEKRVEEMGAPGGPLHGII